MSDVTLGLALIARDEQDTLPGLLNSIEGAFDQVVLVDTGSSDATLAVFADWTRGECRRNPGFRGAVERFDWTDDFAAARNYADSLLTTDWRVSADADDEIRGARRLRRIVAAAPPEVSAFTAGYCTAVTGTGQAACYVKRLRVVRTGAGKWEGRVHETLTVDGPAVEIPSHLVEWVHRAAMTDAAARASLERNVGLLRSWLRDEPGNPVALRLLGESLAATGHHGEALTLYSQYLALCPGWGEVRARVHRQIGASLLALNRPKEAQAYAEQAVAAMPAWPESYLTLAEAHLALGRPLAAIKCAQTALRLGPPLTGLVVKPLEFTVGARLLIARGLRESGDEGRARAVADELLTALGDAGEAIGRAPAGTPAS